MLVPKRLHYVLYFSSISWQIRSQVFDKLYPSVPVLYANVHPAVKTQSNPFIHGIFCIFWCNLMIIIILCWSLSSATHTNTQSFNKHKQAESDILFQYVLSAVSQQLSLCFTQAHTQLELIATEKIPECYNESCLCCT